MKTIFTEDNKMTDFGETYEILASKYLEYRRKVEEGETLLASNTIKNRRNRKAIEQLIETNRMNSICIMDVILEVNRRNRNKQLKVNDEESKES